MIKAAIFDLDGTLLDSEILWVAATEEYLNDTGHLICYEDALALVYGRSWTNIYEGIIARFPEIDETMEEMEESLRVYIQRMQNGHDMLIEGSVMLLKRLARDMPVCIVSGAPRTDVEMGIDMMEVHNDLKFIISAEDYAIGKPDPSCFLMAAERLKVSPNQCVVFEDSAAGIQAAKAAGMRAVALVREGLPEQDVSSADQIIEDLALFDITTLSRSLKPKG